ncbi:MAG TPA: CpsD/CapB family tyrosine-protein kinase, partial [Phycicoccus sp.]|nr:CpsD/CapB family tyrosine-protein kinase [Phycicoccus sp.]
PTPEQARDVADATIQATALEASRLEMGGELRSGEEPLVKVIPVENALLPGGPSGPNMDKYGMTGALAGLGLAYTFILGRRFLDTRLRSSKDLEAHANTTALGIIPQTPELRAKEGRGKVGRLGVAAEGFRQLRTNLRFVSVDNPPKSIVITSANPSEGKSTVSATLARVLGEAGQPTILIDADLRRPSLATIFEKDGAVGLSQILSGQVDVEDALQDTDQVLVKLLPAGRIPPNPSELLGSLRMKTLIEELSKDHLVLLDAPPLLPVTDAGLLSGVTDGTLLVFAIGKTHKEQVAFCAKILEQVGGNLLGAVLNLAPKRGIGSVAYGNGYTGYGYGYGYKYRYRKYDYATASKGRRRKSRGLFGKSNA